MIFLALLDAEPSEWLKVVPETASGVVAILGFFLFLRFMREERAAARDERESARTERATERAAFVASLDRVGQKVEDIHEDVRALLGRKRPNG